MNRILILLASLCSLTLSAAAAPAAFDLKEGDRVAFIGDTLIEREQYHGWIELMLTARFPDRHATFRNLGWSADTPAGDSRYGLSLTQAGHEPAEEGWKQLQKQITDAKPSVAVLGYGMASSFAGEAGLPKFKADYARLLDVIEKVSPGVRFVFLSPISQENVPATDARHEQLKLYAAAIQELAASRQALFVNLFAPAAAPKSTGPRTENGIHLGDHGYRLNALIIEMALFGSYGKWPDASATEPLRQVILRKNEFFFHRSRPANMAYIFGFRRGEQGRNAVEMPRFDPLIAEEEKKISKLAAHLGEKNYQPAPEMLPAKLRPAPAAAKHTPQPLPQFKAGEGLEVTLWAENPLLAKPIHMNFDSQGRLWVASSEVYPQIEPGQAPTDKIIVLEDTDGGGKANKHTVFAEGLLIPTGIEPGDGGCYVAQSTELLHFKDTNGDGKSDVRRIVLSGFGTEDTHHNLHTLRWGLDGRLWMNQSIYTRTDTETPRGVLRHKSGAVMALNTRTLDFEVVFKGWCNPWGHQFDEFGQSFVTDGAGGQGVSWAVPGAMYFTYAKMRRELKSISPGGYPKFASLEILSSDMFPKEWQGSFLTCDFRANRVTRFSSTELNSGYVTKQEADIMRTTTSTFRPIDVKMGPDGAFYIADWSNPIIQHGEVDFRDPRRDHEHGRIWRVAWKGGKVTKKTDFTKAANKALLDELLSPNSFNRAQARRVLAERGAEKVLPDLKTWLAKQSNDKATLEGAWMLQSLGQTPLPLAEQLAASKDARIRAAATRLLAEAKP